jgi:hypothetical protein
MASEQESKATSAIDRAASRTPLGEGPLGSRLVQSLLIAAGLILIGLVTLVGIFAANLVADHTDTAPAVMTIGTSGETVDILIPDGTTRRPTVTSIEHGPAILVPGYSEIGSTTGSAPYGSHSTTTNGPSDTFLLAALGVGGVLVLAGVFYARQFSIEGGPLKLTVSDALSTNDTKALASAVVDAATAAASPAAPGAPPREEEIARLVQAAAPHVVIAAAAIKAGSLSANAAYLAALHPSTAMRLIKNRPLTPAEAGQAAADGIAAVS